MVLEKTLGSPLDCKEIQPVHPKGDQSWLFIGRTSAEAETPILWPPHAKNWLIGKDPDAGKNWGQEEKGTTEDKMAGSHHEMASPTWWAWVWVNSGSWWWTGRPGVLRFMGSQRVRQGWATELDWMLLCMTSKNNHSFITIVTKVLKHLKFNHYGWKYFTYSFLLKTVFITLTLLESSGSILFTSAVIQCCTSRVPNLA